MGSLRSNVIGFDDGPFHREHRGDVPLVGVVCARTRVDGVLLGKVRRDGANATAVIASLLLGSQFRDHVRDLLAATRLHGHLPEALRVAHLVAGAVVDGRSRGRA